MFSFAGKTDHVSACMCFIASLITSAVIYVGIVVLVGVAGIFSSG